MDSFIHFYVRYAHNKKLNIDQWMFALDHYNSFPSDVKDDGVNVDVIKRYWNISENTAFVFKITAV